MASSWNDGKSNKQGVEGVAVSGQAYKTENGVSTCAFTLENALSVTPPGASENREFSFADTKYHLLVSLGDASGDTLQYHASKVPSSEAVDLTSASRVSGAAPKTVFVKAHGCLMIVAWLLCAAVGMMFARDEWVDGDRGREKFLRP